jgi:Homeodomain-like domain
MNVRYRVALTQYERNELLALLSGGKQAARKLKRAQILLAADAGVGDEDIATSVGVGGSTVYRTKRRFVEGNLERALALGDVARAKGMTQIAQAAGLGRESLYKALSPDGNPELATVLKVLRALGLKLTVAV